MFLTQFIRSLNISFGVKLFGRPKQIWMFRSAFFQDFCSHSFLFAYFSWQKNNEFVGSNSIWSTHLFGGTVTHHHPPHRLLSVSAIALRIHGVLCNSIVILFIERTISNGASNSSSSPFIPKRWHSRSPTKVAHTCSIIKVQYEYRNNKRII